MVIGPVAPSEGAGREWNGAPASTMAMIAPVTSLVNLRGLTGETSDVDLEFSPETVGEALITAHYKYYRVFEDTIPIVSTSSGYPFISQSAVDDDMSGASSGDGDGLADAGEICLTGALNADSEVPSLLSKAGYNGEAEVARLKGVSAEEQIYRYRGAA